MFNLFKFSRTIKKLTSKVVGNDDTLLVVTKEGVPNQVSASSFNPIFAHASFDGSTGNSFDGSTISGDNIKSVTRNEQGVFRLEFTSPHSTGKYTVVATSGSGNHTSSSRAVSVDECTPTSVTIRVERTDTGSQQDEPYIAVLVIG